MLRATTVGYVAQGAGGGLNPGFRVGRLRGETVRGHLRAQRGAADRASAARHAELDAVEGILRRYLHQFSGGQQQRVAIAMALTGDHPSVLVLDEPTAGLDTTPHAQILDAIDALRRHRHRTMLLISVPLPRSSAWASNQRPPSKIRLGTID